MPQQIILHPDFAMCRDCGILPPMKKHFFLVSLLTGLSSLAFAGEWLTNYDQALSQAKSQNKQLLMDFTGSDWCGWCIKLDKEVFLLPEFKSYADQNLVLLQVDFPRQKTLPQSEKDQNSQLAVKFKVEGYPTIVVLNPDGSKAGELGYVEGGPKAFIATLAKEAPKK